MNRAVVAVGSNIEPAGNVAAVLEILRREQTVTGESAFVTTKPVGPAGQPDFLNGAVHIETGMEREKFGAYLKHVERRLGRRPGHDPYAPRPMDLDLVAWNNEIIDPDYYRRDFLKRSVDEVMGDEKGARIRRTRARPDTGGPAMRAGRAGHP